MSHHPGCVCGLMGTVLDASSSGCFLCILSKLGHKIVLPVNVFIISQFLHHEHSLPVFSLSSSTARLIITSKVYPSRPTESGAPKKI